jgi:LysM repeat protein
MFCQNGGMDHHPRMKSVLWIPASCALVLSLSSCGNSGGSGSAGPGASTGPFDSRGNYVEEWADNPSKWRKSGGSPSPHESRSDELPEIALNDQPPSNSVPLPPSNPNKSVPVISETRVTQQKPTTGSSSSTSRTRSSADTADSTASRPKATATVSKPKPKPVLVKAKPKAKPKPKAVRYVVKKGDSLSAIASRTGASVSAIKSANGISGTLIRPGQSLTIPKR